MASAISSLLLMSGGTTSAVGDSGGGTTFGSTGVPITTALAPDVRLGVQDLVKRQFYMLREKQRLAALRSGTFFREVLPAMYDANIIDQERFGALLKAPSIETAMTTKELLELAVMWGITASPAAFWKTHRNREDLLACLQLRKHEMEMEAREAQKRLSGMPSASEVAEMLTTTQKRVEDVDPEKRRRNSLATLASLFSSVEAVASESSGNGVDGMVYMARRLSMDEESLKAMKQAIKASSAMVKAARTQARRRALANSALGADGGDGEEDREDADGKDELIAVLEAQLKLQESMTSARKGDAAAATALVEVAKGGSTTGTSGAPSPAPACGAPALSSVSVPAGDVGFRPPSHGRLPQGQLPPQSLSLRAPKAATDATHASPVANASTVDGDKSGGDHTPMSVAMSEVVVGGNSVIESSNSHGYSGSADRADVADVAMGGSDAHDGDTCLAEAAVSAIHIMDERGECHRIGSTRFFGSRELRPKHADARKLGESHELEGRAGEEVGASTAQAMDLESPGKRERAARLARQHSLLEDKRQRQAALNQLTMVTSNGRGGGRTGEAVHGAAAPPALTLEQFLDRHEDSEADAELAALLVQAPVATATESLCPPGPGHKTVTVGGADASTASTASTTSSLGGLVSSKTDLYFRPLLTNERTVVTLSRSPLMDKEMKRNI